MTCFSEGHLIFSFISTMYILKIYYLYLYIFKLDTFTKGRVKKKIWIYAYLGRWVGQDGDNIHKKQKNMPLKSI